MNNLYRVLITQVIEHERWITVEAKDEDAACKRAINLCNDHVMQTAREEVDDWEDGHEGELEVREILEGEDG